MSIGIAIEKMGLANLARALGMSNQRVWNWRVSGVPETLAPRVEALTGVPREQLRPDVDWSKYDRKCPVCGHCHSKTHARRVGKANRKRKEILAAKAEG